MTVQTSVVLLEKTEPLPFASLVACLTAAGAISVLRNW